MSSRGRANHNKEGDHITLHIKAIQLPSPYCLNLYLATLTIRKESAAVKGLRSHHFSKHTHTHRDSFLTSDLLTSSVSLSLTEPFLSYTLYTSFLQSISVRSFIHILKFVICLFQETLQMWEITVTSGQPSGHPKTKQDLFIRVVDILLHQNIIAV